MSEAPAGQVIKDFGITGTTFCPGATGIVPTIPYLALVDLQREPTNKYDENAVAVHWRGRKLGFLPAGLAKEIAPLMDAGQKVVARRKRDIRFGICEIAFIPAPPEAPPKEVPHEHDTAESAADSLDLT